MGVGVGSSEPSGGRGGPRDGVGFPGTVSGWRWAPGMGVGFPGTVWGWRWVGTVWG